MKHPSLRPIHLLVPLVLMTAGSAGAQDSDFFISGYGNVHYMKHSGLPTFSDGDDFNNGILQLREFSLFMDVAISDTLMASAEIEVGNNGKLLTTNYAYLDIAMAESLTLRIGKYLVPFLDYNENKPSFKQSLMSQPFTAWITVPVNGTPGQPYGFGWSDVGAMADWKHVMGDVGLIGVKAGIINGLQSSSDVAFDFNDVTLSSGPTIRARDGLIQNEAGTNDNNDNKAVVAKITYQDMDTPFNAGLSFYQGKWDSVGSKDLRMYGLHANWEEELYSFKAEYSINEVEQDAGALLPGPPGLNRTTGDYQMNAFYVEGTYTPFVWEDERWLKFILRYDAVDSNDQAAFTPFRRSRYTGGLEWQFTDGARFRAEYQRHTIDDFDKAPAPYLAAGGEENIDMLMLSIIFWF